MTDRPPPMRVRRPGERRSVSRSATRALDVLELFGEKRRPLRAIEIATALDLHPSTTNQLLKTMVDSAHLSFEAGGKTYLPSPRLAPFWSWMVTSYGASEGVRRLMREVQAATGAIVTLTTPNDLFMQIIDWAGDGPGVFSTERGLLVPIFETAIGMAYLTTLPEAAIKRLAIRGRLAPPKISLVLAEVEKSLRKRVCVSETIESGLCSLATPLPPAGLPAPLVLGLAGPFERVSAEQAQLSELLLVEIARWASNQSPSAEGQV